MNIQKKIMVFILLSILLPSVLFADDRKVLAVPAIEAKGVAESLASTCRNILEAALIKTGAFSVMSYTDVEEILEAQAFSLSGCTDDSCAVEIGELLSAEKIVVGSIDGIGEAMVLTVRLVDVEKGTIEKAEVVDIDKVESLQAQAFTAAYRLAGLKYIAGADSAVKEKGALYVTAPVGLELDVFLDGREMGRTPFMINDIDFGVHILKATTGDYIFESEININTTEITEIIADNSLLRGNLLVRIANKEAEGFTVQFGSLVLKTGLNKELPVGKFPLKIRGNFWYYDGEVEISNGKTSTVSIELEKGSDIKLNVPEGAESRLVSTDAKEFYFTESSITVPAGDYGLVVEHEDYETYRQNLTAGAGKVLEISPLLAHTELYLNREKLAQLKAERTSMLKTRKSFTIGAITSFCLAAAGGIATGVLEAFIASESSDLETNYEAYNSATISTDAATYRTAVETNTANISTFRLIRNISMICAGVGAAGGTTLFFVRPSTDELDAQIASLSQGVE